jgi:hypothetical protein
MSVKKPLAIYNGEIKELQSGDWAGALRLPHTWVVGGEIKLPSGSTDFIGGFFVDLPSGQSSKIVKARFKCYDGAITLKIVQNTTDRVTDISVSSTADNNDFTDFDLADGDWIGIVVTDVSGTPHALQFTLYEDRSF